MMISMFDSNTVTVLHTYIRLIINSVTIICGYIQCTTFIDKFTIYTTVSKIDDGNDIVRYACNS